MTHNVPKVGDMVDSVFGPVEVISVYTDDQAIEDGVIIPIEPLKLETATGKPIMRMTRTLWSTIISHQMELDVSPDVVRAGLEQLKAIISTLEDTAQPGEPKGYLYAAEPEGLPVIWCIDNGYEQFTIMLRSDY